MPAEDEASITAAIDRLAALPVFADLQAPATPQDVLQTATLGMDITTNSGVRTGLPTRAQIFQSSKIFEHAARGGLQYRPQVREVTSMEASWQVVNTLKVADRSVSASASAYGFGLTVESGSHTQNYSTTIGTKFRFDKLVVVTIATLQMPPPGVLRRCLTEAASAELDACAEDFVEDFGQFHVSNCAIGGIGHIEVTAEQNSFQSYDLFVHSARIAASTPFASASYAGRDVNSNEHVAGFDSLVVKCHALGGNPQLFSAQRFEEWHGSVKSTPCIHSVTLASVAKLVARGDRRKYLQEVALRHTAKALQPHSATYS